MCRVDFDDERPEVSSTYRVKAARKTHVCTECRRQIEIGEPYEYYFGVYMGDAIAAHTCRHCCVATRWLSINCNGYVFGDVRDDIEEHAHDYGRSDLARIAVSMRRKWKQFNADTLMEIPNLPASVRIE